MADIAIPPHNRISINDADNPSYSAEVSSTSRLKVAIDGEGWDPTNKVIIWDGTDYAEVGSDNRLWVEAKINAIPATAVEYRGYPMEDSGGSYDMNVNGSVTPVDFTFTPGTSEIWYMERITWMFNDSGAAKPVDFGCIADGLTNGVLIKIKSNGTETTIGTIKNNIEVAQMFTEAAWTPTAGFMGGENVYMGSVLFRNSFKLSNATGDYVKFTVQDDLTGLDFFQINTLVWREQ